MVPRVRTRRQGSCHASAEHFQQCAELPPLGRLLSCQYPAQQTSGCRRLSARCYRLGGIPAVFPIRPPASFQTFKCARAGARTAMHSTAAISHRSALTRAAPSIPCASTRYLRAPHLAGVGEDGRAVGILSPIRHGKRARDHAPSNHLGCQFVAAQLRQSLRRREWPVSSAARRFVPAYWQVRTS
jgi:hypothetical protein